MNTRQKPIEFFAMNAAAIDLGTNSIKILIVRRDGRDGEMQVLFRHRSVVRLGEGTFKKSGRGKIPRNVQLRTLKVFQNYEKLLQAYDVDVVRATGTSALRDSENGPTFVAEVREKTGIALEVLPAEEEARLIAKGVASEFDLPKRKPVLFVDIGGGSLEISLALNNKIEKFVSLPLGAVRLNELYIPQSKPGRKKISALVNHVRKTLRKEWPDPPQIKQAYGSAGTIRAVGRILSKKALSDDPRRIRKSQVDKLVAEISKYSKKKIGNLPGVDSKRAEILTAGALVFKETLHYFGIEDIFISQRGLREGMLIDLLEEPTPGPHAAASDEFEVKHLDFLHRLGRRYHSEHTHCYQVWKLANQLFDEMAPIHGLGGEWKQILMVAALLHDVGKFVNLSSSHKHTFYIIKNSIFPFLSEKQVLLTAVLARYHRKSPPRDDHEGYKDLDSAEKKAITKLASLLRMADALDAPHDQGVRWLKCQWGPGKVKLFLKMKNGAALDWESINDKFKLFESTFNSTVVIGEVSASGMTPSRFKQVEAKSS